MAVVSIANVSKRFGATQALDDVCMDLSAGEIVALAGENGAGKSTLMRILAGVLGDYSGEVRLDGELVRFASPRAAREAGVVTIHQELSLVGSMTVAENIGLPVNQPMWRRVSARAENARAREVLEAMALDVDPEVTVESLPLATRQLVEIARALAQQTRVLILDEPTSALSDAEAEALFEQLETLRDRGVAIVFISHRMAEMYRVADRITVLRDGKNVITARPAELPRADLVRHMVGVERRERATKSSPSEHGDVLLEVRGTVSFDVAAGEVLGVTGLHGSGVDVLVGRIFGVEASDVVVRVAGQTLRPPHPRACIGAGMILLAGDREASLVSALSVMENTTLSALASFSRYGWVDARAQHRAAASAREKLRIVCPSLRADVRQLSGGNQQKVAIARCLEIKPRVLLLHEPSRGIDVGAKEEVHALIRELAHQGIAVVIAGTDLDELLSLCDRMLVMRNGEVALDLERASFSHARILAAGMGEA